jgi:hypothetical protein
MFGRLRDYWNTLPKFSEPLEFRFSLANMFRAMSWLAIWLFAGVFLPLHLEANSLEPPLWLPEWVQQMLYLAYTSFVLSGPFVVIAVLFGKTRQGLMLWGAFAAFYVFLVLICAIVYSFAP